MCKEINRCFVVFRMLQKPVHNVLKAQLNNRIIKIKITNRCDICTMSLFPFSRLFPTCFGPSWAHHQEYFKLLFLCYHLVHAVLCWSSACVSER